MNEQPKGPVDLQAHYIQLITEAVEATGGFCRVVTELAGSGNIWVSRSETTTAAEYCIRYTFNEIKVIIGVTFADDRPDVVVKATYWDGIDEFFPLFAKALKANRLEQKEAA